MISTESFNTGTQDMLINFKVYIAGQYAPAQDITAQSGVFSLSEAQVTLYPHPNLVDFGENDRVPIQIFFLDAIYNPKRPEYKLIFEGEIVSYEYNRTPNSIGCTVSAVSHFEILAQIFMTFYKDLVSEQYRAGTQLGESKSKLNLASLVGNDLMSNFSDEPILRGSAKSFNDTLTKSFLEAGGSVGGSRPMMRPFTFLKNLLLNIVNTKALTSEAAGEVHIFFKSFFAKRRIHETIFASPILEDPSDESNSSANSKTMNIILEAVQNDDVISVLTGAMSFLAREFGNNQDVSFWDMLSKVYSILMYECLLPICPPYLKADLFGIPVNTSGVKYEPNAKTDPLEGTVKYEGIMSLLTKPQILFGVPPMCNTIFPSMINSYSYRNRHFTKPTRFYLENPDIITRQGKSSGANNALLNSIFLASNSKVYPEELDQYRSKGDFSKVKKILQWSLDPEETNEFFRGPVILANRVAPSWVNHIKRQYVKTDDKKAPVAFSEDIKAEKDRIIADTERVLTLLAKNEFAKEVSSRRVLSLDLKFNPYLMPGFPMVVIENINLKQYFYALLINVTHRLGNGVAATRADLINITPFNKAVNETLLGNSPYNILPANPSDKVSAVFNTYTGAERYYKAVLYQKESSESAKKASRISGLKYAFNPIDYFYMTTLGDIDTSVDATKDAIRPGVREGARKYFTDYVEALKLTSRPIASMYDFVNSRKELRYMDSKGDVAVQGRIDGKLHGGVASVRNPKDFTGGSDFKAVAHPSLKSTHSPATSMVEGAPIYYDQILAYTYMNQEAAGGRLFSEDEKVKPKDVDTLPDFIKDWATLIRQYREDVLKDKDGVTRDFFT